MLSAAMNTSHKSNGRGGVCMYISNWKKGRDEQ
jgi:hypothetical protein